MNTSFPGSEPMVRIDGDKVRQLRERKGLTQLYVATVVGVTTDTVSRWENRRYPSIKRDNALKLAEALEVEIEAILEEQKEEGLETPPASGPPKAGETEEQINKQPTPPKMRRWLLPLLLATALLVLVLLFWWRHADRHTLTITAFRALPAHTAPGQPFPVLITVSTTTSESFPLILKEILPSDCAALSGEPEITNIDGRDNTIKWIGRTAGLTTVFAYMAGTTADTPLGRKLTFAGTVTLKGQGREQGDIQGDTAMMLEAYHWADTNEDNKIDDNEILTVYDRYSVIPGLDFDRERIDEIWAAQGYRWDPAKADFIIIP